MSLTRLLILSIACLAFPVLASAQFDEVGNYIGDDEIVVPQGTPVQSCGECKEPDFFSWGVAFRGTEKWIMDLRRTLYRLDECEPVEAIPISGVVLPTGLGYDSKRDLLILADASFNRAYQLTPSGRVITQWPTPGPGPVGAAYDSRRDLYWFSDWEIDRLYSIDPQTGQPGPSFAAPEGSRISGTAYDAELDALIYHGRNEASTYWVSIETGQVLGMFSVPQGGQNNGSGVGLDPANRAIWLTHFEDTRLFCVQGLDDGSSPPGHRGIKERRFEELGDNDTGVDGQSPILGGASPNPFNPTTRIRFRLPDAGPVRLAIYDVHGRLVKTLVSGPRSAGEHIVEWRAGDTPSGVYFYRLATPGFEQTKKLVLLK